MCSITEGEERLHNVLKQIWSKLWCPWQQKALIDLQWGKWCLHLFSVAFDLIIFVLAANEDMHKISDEFEFRPDWGRLTLAHWTQVSDRCPLGYLLAHLSRRLIDEIIGQAGIRRRPHFSNVSPQELLGQSKTNFTWSLLGMGERKFA